MKNSLFLLLFGSFISCEKAQPKLEILESNNFDFGIMNVGDTINYTFTLKNTGNSVLKIEQIQPICSCTVSQLETKSIEPNATSKLKIALAGRIEDIGFSDKQVALRTNAEPKMTILHLKGNVIKK